MGDSAIALPCSDVHREDFYFVSKRLNFEKGVIEKIGKAYRFQFKTGIRSKIEIGQLAGAFENRAANLEKITAYRDEYESLSCHFAHSTRELEFMVDMNIRVPVLVWPSVKRLSIVTMDRSGWTPWWVSIPIFNWVRLFCK